MRSEKVFTRKNILEDDAQKKFAKTKCLEEI